MVWLQAWETHQDRDAPGRNNNQGMIQDKKKTGWEVRPFDQAAIQLGNPAISFIHMTPKRLSTDRQERAGTEHT